MKMTDSDKDLLINVREVLNNIAIDTDNIYVADIRAIISQLRKLEVSLTSESSLVMMGMIAQSLDDK